MIEAALLTWMAAAGALVLRPQWARIPPWGLVGLVLPVGAAAYVAVSVAITALGLPFSTTIAVAVTSGAGVAVLLWTAARRGPRDDASVSARTLVTIGAGIVGIGLLALVFEALQLTRVTVDSLRYVLTANVLETTGSLDEVSRYDLRARQLVVPVLHGPGVAAGGTYSAAITPLLTISGLVVTAWLAWEALIRAATPIRWRWWILGAAAALLLTTNRFVYHAFYINGHMMFAVFLVVGVGLGIHAVATADWILLQPAALAFAALVPIRPEAAITAAIFLVPLLTTLEIPNLERWRLLLPYVAVTVLWDGFAWPARAAEADLGLTGPAYGNILVAIALVAGLALVAAPAVAHFAHWGIWAAGAGLAGYVAATAVRHPESLRASLAATGSNLAIEGLWGTFWWVVPLLLVGGWVATSVPAARLWLHPLIVYGVALLAYASLRGSAYRVGTGDSGNRMLVHVVLVAIFGLVATAGHAAADGERQADAVPADAIPAG